MSTGSSDSLITSMNKPNVTIRSNVFVRSDTALRNDRAFIAQVRGRIALLQLLKKLEPIGDTLSTAREFFSRQQLAQVAWQAPCGICGAYPEGPVTRDGMLEIRFRCPRNKCDDSTFVSRSVLLSLDVVRSCAAAFRKPINELVQDALSLQRDHFVEKEITTPLRVPVVVRLTLAQRYFLSDREIESALLCLLHTRGL
jgi:hypothetical protein